MKLDRLLAAHRSMGRRQARLLIAARKVCVDGLPAVRNELEVDRFMQVTAGDEIIQAAQRLLHLMLHKPAGVVSATTDPEHRTVIDLIDDPDRGTLHLAGRLDRFTSGLVLLTNDGRWSKRLMDPERKVPKVYQVETAAVLPDTAPADFAAGFYFHTEDLVTRPAHLEILEPCLARLTLHEGRYHQIKRMVHRVGGRVVSLHRKSIGPIELDPALSPGQWRPLTAEEISLVYTAGIETRHSSTPEITRDSD